MLSLTLKQILRRPKYPLAIGIGIMLAVSIIVGTNLAIDNVAKMVFQNELNKIPVDFVVDKMADTTDRLPNTNELKSQLFKIPEIESIEIAWHFNIPNHIISQEPYKGNETEFTALLENTTDKNVISFTLLGVPADFGENVSGITWIAGNFNTTQNNNIAIPEKFAKAYNLSVGDDFYLTALYRIFNVTTLNYTVEIYSFKLHITGIFRFTRIFENIFYKLEGNTLVFLTSFANAYYIRSQLVDGYISNIRKQNNIYTGNSEDFEFATFPAGTFTCRIYIFLDRNKTYNVWTIGNVDAKIKKIETAIFVQLFMDASFHIKFVARSLIDRLKQWSDTTKFQLGIFYIPILIVGIFLSVAASHAILENRKRELNLLAIRGATESQIKVALLVEGLFIGIIASGLGIVLATVIGSITSYIVATKFNITNISISYLPSMDLYTLYGFTIGVVLTLFSVLLAIRELQYLQPGREGKEEISEIRKVSSRRIKLLLLGEIFGIYKIIAWLVNFSSIELFFELNNVNFFIMILVYLFVFIDFMILNPLAPILFVYCTARLISIYMDKIIGKATKIVAYLARTTLGKIALSDILQHPKRYIKVSLVLALAIGFGVFIPIIHASQVQYQVRIIKVTNGADINISTLTDARSSSISEIRHDLNISGINNITFIYYVNIQVNSRSDSAFAINPDKYLSVVKENIAKNFSQNGLVNTLQKMKANTTYAMATEGFLRNNHLKVGDIVNISVKVNETFSAKFSVKVIDIIYLLPGVSSESFFGLGLDSRIVLNSELLKSENIIDTANFTNAMISYVLVDTASDADAINVGRYIRTNLGYTSVQITKEQIDALASNPLASTIYEILDMEYFLMFFVATIGIGFVLSVEITERKREFAIMLARGATSRQLFAFVFTELAFVVFLSVLIGVITGYLGGASYMGVIVERNTILVPRNQYLNTLTPEIVVPPTVYYVILGSIISLLFVMAVPMYILRKTNIREVLQSEVRQI